MTAFTEEGLVEIMHPQIETVVVPRSCKSCDRICMYIFQTQRFCTYSHETQIMYL